MKRRTVKPVKIRHVADAKIRPASSMRCPVGHDFGLDKDRCARFYGRLPESIACPLCGSRTRVVAASA